MSNEAEAEAYQMPRKKQKKRFLAFWEDKIFFENKFLKLFTIL